MAFLSGKLFTAWTLRFIAQQWCCWFHSPVCYQQEPAGLILSMRHSKSWGLGWAAEGQGHSTLWSWLSLRYRLTLEPGVCSVVQSVSWGARRGRCQCVGILTAWEAGEQGRVSREFAQGQEFERHRCVTVRLAQSQQAHDPMLGFWQHMWTFNLSLQCLLTWHHQTIVPLVAVTYSRTSLCNALTH